MQIKNHKIITAHYGIDFRFKVLLAGYMVAEQVKALNFRIKGIFFYTWVPLRFCTCVADFKFVESWLAFYHSMALVETSMAYGVPNKAIQGEIDATEGGRVLILGTQVRWVLNKLNRDGHSIIIL